MNYEEFKQKLNTLDKLDFNKGVSLSDDGFVRYWIEIKKENNEYKWYATEPVKNAYDKQPMGREFNRPHVTIRTQDTKTGKPTGGKKVTLEKVLENLKAQNDKLIEEAEAEAKEVIKEEDAPVEAEPVVEDTVDEDSESTISDEDIPNEEDSEFNQKFNATTDKMYESLKKGELMFGVAKMHYKEKPTDANAFHTIWNNLETCTIEQPYTVDKLQTWLEQGSVIVPFTEIEGIRYYTLLIFDVDNDNQELLDQLNDGKQFTMEDIFNHYNPILQANPLLYYESYSSTADNLRFRLIFELSSPLSQREYTTFYNRIAKDWGAIVHDKNGKEVYKSVIDSSIGASRHVVFGTNKETMLYEDWGTVPVDSILPIIEEELGKGYSKETTYSNDIKGVYFPVRRIVELTDEKLKEYKDNKFLYEIKDIFKLFDIASYFDVFSWLFPHKLEGSKGQHTYCPFCDTKNPHHGFHDAGNCGVDFRDDCPVPLNEKGYHAIHVNDIIKLYYGVKDLEIAYYILCDMLEVEPINEYSKEYITKKNYNNKKLRGKKTSHGRDGIGDEAPANDGDTSKSDGNRLTDALNFLNNLNWIDSKDKQEAYKEPGTELCTNGLKTSTLNFIIGDANCGKSSVSFGMTYHLAYEPYVFYNEDMKVLEPVRSLIVNFETGYDHMKEGYPIIDDSISYINLSNQYEVTDDRIYLDDLDLIEAFFVKAVQESRKLIIFDPLYRMSAEVDDAKRKELEPYLDNFRKLAKKYDVCVIIILHTNRDSAKANARFGAAPDMSNVQGSIVINQIADTVIALYPVVDEDEEKDNIDKKNAELKDRVRTTGFTFLKERGVAWRTYMIQWKTTKYFMEAKRCPRYETLNSKGEPRQRYDKNAKTKLYVEGVKERMPIDTIFNMGTLANWIHKDEEFKKMNIESTVSYLKNEFCSKIIDDLMEDGYLEQIDNFKYKKRK